MIPSAPDSERYILSCMFQWPDRFIPRILGDGLGEDHFTDPSRAFMFTYFKERHRAGDAIDLILVVQDLKKRPEFSRYWDSPAPFGRLFSFAQNSGTYSHHIAALIKSHGARVALRNAGKLSEMAEDGSYDPEELETAAREGLEDLSRAFSGSRGGKTAKEAAVMFLDHMEAMIKAGGIPGLKTGIRDFDELGGPRRGELWVIGGHPSRGKSVLMLQMVGGMARHGMKAQIFSLEMTVNDVTGRLCAGTYGADFSVCYNPIGATKGELEGIRDALPKVMNLNMVINDDPELTSDRIWAEVEMEHDRNGLDVVVIDYIQLMEGERGRKEKRDEEISRNVKRLKQMAKKFDIVVLTASQLNDDGKLFAARAIGHHADIVMGIQDDGLWVTKYRNSKANYSIPLVMNGEQQRFVKYFPPPEK